MRLGQEAHGDDLGNFCFDVLYKNDMLCVFIRIASIMWF